MASVFLLSPARCSGIRAGYLMHPMGQSVLAKRLRQGPGVSIGELFTFMSGLYFRGKLAYAEAFGAAALVIAPGRGLLPASTLLTLEELRAIAAVPVDLAVAAYREPLVRDAGILAQCLAPDDRAILLGSIATSKYLHPLLEVLDGRLYYPKAFMGRGDMSRGALMLRCARRGKELTYLPVTSVPGARTR